MFDRKLKLTGVSKWLYHAGIIQIRSAHWKSSSSFEEYFVSNQNLKLRNHRVSAGDKRELTDNFSGIEQWTSHKGWLSVKRFLSSDKFIFVKKEKKILYLYCDRDGGQMDKQLDKNKLLVAEQGFDLRPKSPIGQLGLIPCIWPVDTTFQWSYRLGQI